MIPELVLLGTGTAVPTALRGPTAELIVDPHADDGERGADVTLVDPGPGSVKRAFDAGVRPESIRRVLLTHHHVDHVLDLVALLFARMNPFLEPKPAGLPLLPLEILGGPGTVKLVDGLAAIFGGGLVTGGAGGAGVSVVELAPGDFALAPCIRGTAYPVVHSPPSLAYRLAFANGATLALSGDTGDCAGAIEVGRSADHYLLEAALPLGPGQPRIAGHIDAREAGRIAAASGCGHLILNHFYPAVDLVAAEAAARESFTGRLTIGCDGMRIAIECERGRECAVREPGR